MSEDLLLIFYIGYFSPQLDDDTVPVDLLDIYFSFFLHPPPHPITWVRHGVCRPIIYFYIGYFFPPQLDDDTVTLDLLFIFTLGTFSPAAGWRHGARGPELAVRTLWSRCQDHGWWRRSLHHGKLRPRWVLPGGGGLPLSAAHGLPRNGEALLPDPTVNHASGFCRVSILYTGKYRVSILHAVKREM